MNLTTLRNGVSSYFASFYAENPDDNRNYALKEEHTYRVADNARIIAMEEAPDREDVLLAEAAGLCHDLGRFPQYRNYRTFRDADSVNHAALSARVMAQEGLAADFPAEERAILLRAVTLHNVFALPHLLTGKALLQARIVRDADKLDIWRVFIDEFSAPEEQRASAAPLGFPDNGQVSPEVVGAVEEGRMVRLETVRTLDDFRLLQLSWVFDLSFGTSLRLFRHRDILGRFVPFLPPSPVIAAAVERIDRFVSTRLESGL